MEKTIKNLIDGIIGESTAGATYAAFAAQAAREGYPEIQKMFEATSKAESIHAANHARVLKKLGGELPKFKIEIEVGTTLENLAAALREMKTRVVVPDDISVRARRAIEAMLAIH